MKFPEHRARQIARDAKGSLIALLWLAGSGPLGRPRWASRKDATTHASLILAGSWIGSNEHDTKIVERLSRKQYRDIETLLQAAMLPEGPWLHQGIEWACASKAFVWGQLAEKLTETMLEDFDIIVREVLGEKDPSIELPRSERNMAKILGKTRKYSSSLRRGLVDSVARLAVVRADGQRWADKIVRGLLDPEHPEALTRWLSLADVYSEVAEAAPSVFLHSLDRMTRLRDAKQFFQDEDGAAAMFGPWSPHVYLLWALERLAWQHEYFSSVLSLLAKLAEIDPGAKTSNRPKNSLIMILQPWCPQHIETMQNAAQTLEMLYGISPGVTWEVAIHLLPSWHGISFPTSTPDYRQHSGKRQYNEQEYLEFIRILTRLVVRWAGCDGNRWVKIIEAYPHTRRRDAHSGQEITDALGQVDIATLTDDCKATICDALTKLIANHRRFADAPWALDEPELAKLEALRARYTPTDAVLLYKHLFAWAHEVPDA
jgi:hypothetical protein